MALEDPDIGEFTSEEEVEEIGPTPIPSSSQEEQQPAAILPSSQQDADATVSSTQQHSIDGSQEGGSKEELRLSQALSLMQQMDEWMQQNEKIRQCRAELAEERATIGRLDHDSEGGEERVALSGEHHQVEVEMGQSQDEVESHRKVATEMRKFLELEQLFEQIQGKKEQVEKEMKQGRVGSLPEFEQRVALLVEAKQRISRHLEAQKKKVAIICTDPRSTTTEGVILGVFERNCKLMF